MTHGCTKNSISQESRILLIDASLIPFPMQLRLSRVIRSQHNHSYILYKMLNYTQHNT